VHQEVDLCIWAPHCSPVNGSGLSCSIPWVHPLMERGTVQACRTLNVCRASGMSFLQPCHLTACTHAYRIIACTQHCLLTHASEHQMQLTAAFAAWSSATAACPARGEFPLNFGMLGTLLIAEKAHLISQPCDVLWLFAAVLRAACSRTGPG
jgi:hypothetical protein